MKQRETSLGSTTPENLDKKSTLRDTYMNLHRKEKKTSSPETVCPSKSTSILDMVVNIPEFNDQQYHKKDVYQEAHI